MLKKLISLLLTTSLSLGTISYITFQSTEAATSRYNRKVNYKARYHKRYRVKRTKNYFKLRKAIKKKNLNMQVGIASHYGHNDGYNGRKTASGIIFNKYSNTCAHKSFKFGTVLSVTNLSNNKNTICVIRDRGPYSGNRILDLSFSSFNQIANPNQGLIKVKIEKVN